MCICCCSVTKSCPTLCNPMDCSPPCFSGLHYFPWVCSNSCPLSHWHHPTISSSVALFSCLKSSPGSGSFLMSQLFASGGQSIGTWASASVLPVVWSPCSPKDSQEHHSSKTSILWQSAFFMVQPSHPYMTTGKTIALTTQTFVITVMSLLFNMLSLS